MVNTQQTGLLNIDKPAGLTSHDVVNQVRRITGVRRVGHAGTLDPLATGVLVLAVGRATRLLEYIVGRPKTYLAQVRLGQTTTTYDAEGEVVADRPVTSSKADLLAVLGHYRGEIKQVPPMFSALKREGQSLYTLARQGVTVDRPPRPVTIYTLDLLNWAPPVIELQVTCSAGTYVRALAHDIGEDLGCGGYLAGLRRTHVGTFTVEAAITLADLTTENWRNCLLPPDQAVAHLPRLEVDEGEAGRLKHGQWLACREGQPEGDLARVYDPAGTFLGIVSCQNHQWRPRKMWVVADG